MRHFLSAAITALLIIFTGQASANAAAGSVIVQESTAYYRGECADLSSLSAKERELVAFVCQAKAFALAKIEEMGTKRGLSAAFKEFNRPVGDAKCKAGKCPFQRGKLYIFAYENKRQGDRVARIICRANGANPAMAGKDFFNTGFTMKAHPQYGIRQNPDAKFFRMVSDAAYRKNGYTDGFVLFTWPNPQNGDRIWLKKGYSTKITDTVWIGSGIYIEEVN
ncbi:MAG: hypothetical protein EG826_05360 [Deltaproteobacteria bacterium]|nr:hypothetical protein [Deltaproteobacteria bacterium]